MEITAASRVQSGLRPTGRRFGRLASVLSIAVGACLIAASAGAQPPGDTGGGAPDGAGQEASAFSSADEAARQSSNPLGGDFLILLNQFDNYFLDGDITDETRHINTWAIQPVIPLPMENLIGENWIMVNRPTFPIVLNADLPKIPNIDLSGGGPPEIPSGLPPFLAGGLPFRQESGFGDMVMFNLLGQSLPTERWGGGDLVWALGPTWQFPTAYKEVLGSGKYAVGPSAVGAFIGRRFILGGLFQHWESYASGGKGSHEPVSYSWLNLFYFWNLENGWQIGGTPVITADWEADKDEQRWTVPIGLGVYKTHFFFGKMPIKLGVEMQWMPERPEAYGTEFNIRLVIAPILPSPFGSFKP
jgi:hypothetical protein